VTTCGGVDVDVGSVVVAAAEFVDGVGPQGVPTSSRPVVIIIQAYCDSSDMISAASLPTAARSYVTM